MNTGLRRYEFSERLAEILGESRRDLRFRVTLMVTHGLVAPGPRGPGSPPATPDYAAALLIGVMAAPQQVHTLEAIRCYRELQPTVFAPEAASPGVVVGSPVRRTAERPEPPRLLSSRLRFGDALTRLLDQARDVDARGALAGDLYGVWVARGFPVAAVQLAAWWQGRRTIMTQRYELPEGGQPPAWLDPERGGAADPGLFHSVFLPVGKLIEIGTLTANPNERKPRVLNLDQTIANFASLARKRRNRRPWEKFLETAAAARVLREKAEAQEGQRLLEVRDFGSNPGNLSMLTYVPQDLPASAPLVVVLHGCTQTAASYDYGTGWSTLADRFGFAVLFPEQKRANNPLRCFNWFKADDTGRDRGEPLSIREMVERMIATHKIDPARVFITGVSAGGAMSSIMLATYPELFAGGAIIAGVPYRSADGLQEAFDTIFQGRSRPAAEWGNLVRAASSHQGPWPKVSVWHGDADSTVKPLNADEIIKQWTDVHNLAPTPSRQHKVEGHLRRVWHGPCGEDVIESYTVAGMGHGVPVEPGEKDHQCGRAGPFILDVGISSTWHIARSWGLTETRREVRAAPEHPAQPAQPQPAQPQPAQPLPEPRPTTAHDDEANPPPDLAAVISAQHRQHREQSQHGERARRAKSEDASSFQGRRSEAGTERPEGAAPRGIDLQAILTKSFELAGLATRLGTSSTHAGSGGGPGGGIDIQAILAKSFELASLAKSLGEAGGMKDRADPSGNEHRDGGGDGESGWQGEGWQFLAEGLAAGDREAGDGPVLFGEVSSGINGDGGNRLRTVSRRIFLGQRPSLSYRRRLDLGAAVNMYTSAAFTVLVDGVAVDEVSTMGMDYAESTWTERSGIDLAEFAGRTVTLAFQVAANANVRADVTAKAWVAGIAVEDAGAAPEQ